MADKPRKKWIQKAVPESHKGIFRAKAQDAGMSTRAFAQKHEHDSGKLGNEARLAETLMGLHKTKKKTRAQRLYDGK